MTIEQLFSDKTLKAKQKTATLYAWLQDRSLDPEELIGFSEKLKESDRATCMEALELGTKEIPELGTEIVWNFAIQNLSGKAPRLKWESARVIANIASNHPENLQKATAGLLENACHEGTVVRWSVAYALAEILKLNTSINTGLLPQVKAICESEEKNSIRKIYEAAFKKVSV